MKATRNILTFLLAVALMAGALGYLAPEPHLNIVSAKLEWMRQHGDEFDVLFLGSSRTYHQILPERFEEILGAAGNKVKAFNLGVDGMRPPEDGYVLEQALRGR